jgi:hypothetical protein
MAIYVTYEYFQENLESLLDEVENGSEAIIVQREAYKDIWNVFVQKAKNSNFCPQKFGFALVN